MINNSAFLHENLYRSEAAMRRLREFDLIVCGAGALGANIAESLIRSGFTRLKIIDRDRVEEHNLSTQPYQRTDIGAFKAKIWANMLYRALGVMVDARVEVLTEANAGKLLSSGALVIDTFDNSSARRAIQEYCHNNASDCLHVGLAGDYGEVIWKE